LSPSPAAARERKPRSLSSRVTSSILSEEKEEEGARRRHLLFFPRKKDKIINAASLPKQQKTMALMLIIVRFRFIREIRPRRRYHRCRDDDGDLEADGRIDLLTKIFNIINNNTVDLQPPEERLHLPRRHHQRSMGNKRR